MGNTVTIEWTPEAVRCVFYCWLRWPDLDTAAMLGLALRRWALRTGQTMDEAFAIDGKVNNGSDFTIDRVLRASPRQ